MPVETRSQRSCTVAGYGFIGSALVPALVALGHRVRVLDRKSRPADLASEVEWIQADFPDADGVDEALAGSDVVYHLIASTAPVDMAKDLAADLTHNVKATLEFMERCKARKVGKLVFASSASVYGNQDSEKVSETSPTNPLSPHGIQKLTIEKYLLMARQLNELNTQIFRIANPYGPGQSLRGRQGFVAIVLGNLLRQEATRLRGDGSARRDFIHVTDVAEALASMGMRPGGPPVLNIGSGQSTSLKELIDRIGAISGHKPLIQQLEPLEHEIKDSCFDIALARAQGWAPRISLEKGLLQVAAHHGLLASSDASL